MVQQRRRRWRFFGSAAIASVLGGLAGCGDDGGEAEPAASVPAGTRTIDTEFGPVEVPLEPRRVVALDEYAALNAMAIGVEPVLVFGSFQSEVGGVVIADAGIEVSAAASEDGPNFEAIAAADPDLILFTTEGALATSHEQLSAIAPAVSLPYSTPWRDVIDATAAVFGRTEAAAGLIAAVEARMAPLQEALDEAPMSVSILADSLGMTFAASMVSPMSQIIDEVGFARPPAQRDGEPDTTFDAAIPISLETVGDHDADVVVVLSGAYYAAETILDAPTFQALPAVVEGRSVVVDGDMWFGTYPFAIVWLLEDLAAIHSGEGQAGIGTTDDISARWAAFEELAA